MPSLDLQGSMPQLQGSGTAPSLSLSPQPSQSNQSTLSVDPTSTFDTDTQGKLQNALKLGQSYPQAIQSATQYQKQKDIQSDPANQVAAQAHPGFGGIRGVLENSDSPFNLSTLGSVAGGVAGAIGGGFAMPFTGGLINPVSGAIIGSGVGGGGGEALRENLAGEKLNAGSIGLNTALGAFGEGGGQVAKGVFKAAAPTVANILAGKAERLGLGSLGITKGQSGEFFTQTKGNLGDFITENGLLGKSADDVTALKQATQESYDGIARKSGIQVPVSDLNSSVDEQIAKLRGSAEDGDHEAAQAIEDQHQRALQRMGVNVKDPNATVDIGQVADAKTNFQSKVNWKNADNINAVKGGLADAYMNTVNDAAGGMVDSEGNTLSQLGKKLQGLNLVDKWSQKAANTTGVSKGPFSFSNVIRPAATTVVGTALGGSVGAAVGAGAGILGDVVANSPGVIRAASNAYKGAAGLVDKSASGALPSILGNTVSTANKALNPAITDSTMNANSSTPSLSSVGQSSTQSAQQNQPTDPSVQPSNNLTQDQLTKAINIDVQRTGGANIDKLTKVFQAQNPAGLQPLQTAASGIDSLSNLYDQAGGGKGRIAGGIENAIAGTGLGAPNAQAYNAAASATGQEIISQLYGSGGTSADRDQILSLIPQINDRADVAAKKLAVLKTTVSQRLRSMQSGSPGAISSMSSSPSLNLNQ